MALGSSIRCIRREGEVFASAALPLFGARTFALPEALRHARPRWVPDLIDVDAAVLIFIALGLLTVLIGMFLRMRELSRINAE